MHLTPFARRVLQILTRIPPGRVVTYGDVARLAGRPRAARAVGNIMRAANMPGLPYHRVVAAGGRIGGYGGNPQLKAALLTTEGLGVRRGRIVQFESHRWKSGQRATSGQRAEGKGQRPAPCRRPSQ